MKKSLIITQIWHRVKCHFRWIRNIWYQNAVRNMNKITFSYEISQQTHTIHDKSFLITQIWHRTKCYFTYISIWYPIALPNMLITQIWHRGKFCLSCTRKPWYLSSVPNMKKKHPSSHYGGMHEDGEMDGLTSTLNLFLYSLIPLLRRIIHFK